MQSETPKSEATGTVMLLAACFNLFWVNQLGAPEIEWNNSGAGRLGFRQGNKGKWILEEGSVVWWQRRFLFLRHWTSSLLLPLKSFPTSFLAGSKVPSQCLSSFLSLGEPRGEKRSLSYQLGWLVEWAAIFWSISLPVKEGGWSPYCDPPFAT